MPTAGSSTRRTAGACGDDADGQLRPPLRVLHAAARSQQPADEHRSGHRRRSFTAKDGSVFDRTLIHPDRNDIAPRVGVAWSVTPTAGAARRLRHLLPADRIATAARASSASTCRSWSMRRSPRTRRADAPAFTFAQGFTPLTPQTVNPTRRAVAHPGSEPGHADRAPVQRRPRVPVRRATWSRPSEYVGNRTRNGRRLRNLNQGIIQAPAAARDLPVRAVRLRQRLPRADRHQRPRRLRRAAGALQRRMSGGLGLHGGLHVEQGASATSSIT